MSNRLSASESSQTSPTPSPSASSWFEFATAGQLSTPSAIPSLSASDTLGATLVPLTPPLETFELATVSPPRVTVTSPPPPVSAAEGPTPVASQPARKAHASQATHIHAPPRLVITALLARSVLNWKGRGTRRDDCVRDQCRCCWNPWAATRRSRAPPCAKAQCPTHSNIRRRIAPDDATARGCMSRHRDRL